VLDGNTLNVSMNANGDVATIVGDPGSASISVNGTGFMGVQNITVKGTGLVQQTVNLNGSANLTGKLSVDRVSLANLNGTYTMGGSLNISTDNPMSSIIGNGAFTVAGSTRLSTDGTVDVEGANDFQGPVTVLGGKTVRLKDVNRLALAGLEVKELAAITAGDLDLTGRRESYRSPARGRLFLYAASPTQPMTIGGPAEGYHLSQSDITKLGTTFSMLSIGDLADSNPITVAGLRYYTDTAIRSGRGTITINGEMVTGLADADVRLDSYVGTTLNAGIRAAGGNVSIFSPVTLGTPDSIQIRTAAGSARNKGNIRLDGAVNEDSTPTLLQITAGQDVSLGDVGNLRPVSGVDITSAHIVHFGHSTNAGFIKQQRGTGTTYLGDVVVTKPGTPLDITTVSAHLGGQVTASGQSIQFNVTHGVDQSATAGLNAAALGLRAGVESRLDGSDNDVATLAADLKGALLFHDLNGVTVGTVGTIKGITTQNRDVTLDLGENLTIGSGAGEDINVGSAKLTLKPGAGGAVEKDGSGVMAGALQLSGAGTFDLTQPNNQIQTLLATIDGDMYYRDRSALAIGNGTGPGISTGAGNVQIQTGGILTIKSAISTTPGSGGKLSIIGKESNVKRDAPINLGTGNVTFTVPG